MCGVLILEERKWISVNVNPKQYYNHREQNNVINMDREIKPSVINKYIELVKNKLKCQLYQ